jgi:hypothetical protein
MAIINRNAAERDVFDGIRANWKFLSVKLKTKFPQLTSADLTFETNGEEALLERIELRLNENRKGLISIIETIQYEDLLFRTEV